MKKLLSVFLACVFMIGAVIPAFAVEADTYSSKSDIPIFYCYGKQASILTEDGKTVYPIETSDDYIMNAVKECLPYLFKAIANNNWTEYREKLLSFVEPLYTDLRFDGNGDPVKGTHSDDTWTPAALANSVKSKKGNYQIKDFTYRMDWRLDPFEVADDMHAYIETMKSAAGVEKINGIFRCEGGCVLAAYFAKYGFDDFNCVELYVSCLGGMDTVGAAFGGDIKLDSSSLVRFLDTYEENLKNGIENDVLTEFIYDTLYLLKETYTIDAIVLLLQPLISKLYKELIAPCVLASYGTFPGIWSLVPAEDYANAKKYVFKGVEDEYAGLIKKLDYYQQNVNNKYMDILKNAKEAGVKIAVYAKYGEFAAIPISKANNEVTDGMVTLSRSSFGATTPAYDKLLDKTYLANAAKNGTEKYISPDKKVDVSTALFPDTTWIIFNNYHDIFSDYIHNNLMMEFFLSNGNITVFDDPELPQYVLCENDNIFVPLTEENGFKTVTRDTTVNGTKKSVKEKVIDFVNSLLKLIKQFISSLFKRS